MSHANTFVEEYRKLQHRIHVAREARYRARSDWAWSFWGQVEKQMINRFNNKQGVDYAKLVL
jgi:hypothetical protein